jgi:hypothetical protein
LASGAACNVDARPTVSTNHVGIAAGDTELALIELPRSTARRRLIGERTDTSAREASCCVAPPDPTLSTAWTPRAPAGGFSLSGISAFGEAAAREEHS